MGYYSYIILLLRSRAIRAKKMAVVAMRQGFPVHGMGAAWMEDEKREI